GGHLHLVVVLVLCCCVSFFFQAEDGIRDFHVTGVQTCALPIYHRAGVGRPAGPPPVVRRHFVHSSLLPASALTMTKSTSTCLRRSEERRVGKECRYRWSR